MNGKVIIHENLFLGFRVEKMRLSIWHRYYLLHRARCLLVSIGWYHYSFLALCVVRWMIDGSSFCCPPMSLLSDRSSPNPTELLHESNLYRYIDMYVCICMYVYVCVCVYVYISSCISTKQEGRERF
jgi:hypothetical protein